MILESVDEVRAKGVTVYPHVAGWDTATTNALPGDVAAALFAQHGAGWCERLIEELDALIEVAHDSERHARIWDSIEAQLRVAQ